MKKGFKTINNGAIDIAPLLNQKRMKQHFSSAISFQEKGMTADAVREWKNALTIDKNDLSANLYLAQAYLDCGDFKKARNHFEFILKHRPFDYEILMYIGITYFDSGEHNRALKYFEKVLSVKPDDRETLILLSETYAQIGLVAEASDIADRALKLYPKDPDVFIRKAMALSLYGDFHSAVSVLRESLLYNPLHGETHSVLGTLYLEHDWLDFAINSFKKAVLYLIEPSDTKVKLAAAYFCRGNDEEAVEILSKVLEEKPDCITASLLLINNYIVEEKLDLAESMLLELIEKKCLKISHIYAMLGIIYYKRGDSSGEKKKFKKSATYFKKALRYDPQSVALKINYARALLFSGAMETALTSVESFIKTHPAHPQLYFLLGDIYQSIGLEKFAHDSRRLAESLGSSDE